MLPEQRAQQVAERRDAGIVRQANHHFLPENHTIGKCSDAPILAQYEIRQAFICQPTHCLGSWRQQPALQAKQLDPISC